MYNLSHYIFVQPNNSGGCSTTVTGYVDISLSTNTIKLISSDAPKILLPLLGIFIPLINEYLDIELNGETNIIANANDSICDDVTDFSLQIIYKFDGRSDMIALSQIKKELV